MPAPRSTPLSAALPTQAPERSSRTDRTAVIVGTSHLIPSGDGSLSSGHAQMDPQGLALLAYSYWDERGCQGGSAEEDWLRAERFLATSHGK